jgi:hypothetical protein
MYSIHPSLLMGRGCDYEGGRRGTLDVSNSIFFIVHVFVFIVGTWLKKRQPSLLRLFHLMFGGG